MTIDEAIELILPKHLLALAGSAETFSAEVRHRAREIVETVPYLARETLIAAGLIRGMEQKAPTWLHNELCRYWAEKMPPPTDEWRKVEEPTALVGYDARISRMCQDASDKRDVLGLRIQAGSEIRVRPIWTDCGPKLLYEERVSGE